jgi:MFS transporter, NRE family, putaive nickel resistance protein
VEQRIEESYAVRGQGATSMVGHLNFRPRLATDSLRGNRDFVRLFGAQLTSVLGSGVTSVALAAFAYELAGSNATVVIGMALTLRIVAFVTVSPIAGVLADRVDRKRILVAADLVRVLLMGAFPFITAVWHVYVLIFLLNAVTALFTPAFEASIPELVGPTLYTRAIAWSRVAIDVEAAVGPLVAGLLIAAVGVRWAFWFDGLTYLASAALVLGSRVPRVKPPTARFPWGDLWTQVTHGTRVLLREPALRRALILHVAEAAAGACAIVATIAYVRDVLDMGNTAFALAMAALGLGSSIAALAASRRAERATGTDTAQLPSHLRYHAWATRAMIGGGMLLALALLPAILRPSFGVLLVLWAANGAGQALIAVSSVGLLAAHTSADERGRAYAAHFALTHLFWLFTYPAVGFFSRAAGTPSAFFGMGLLVLVLVAAAVLVGSKAHRPHPLL